VAERRQLLAVVDVEGDKHEYVRRSHSGYVQSYPAAHSTAPRFATDDRGRESKGADDEKVVGVRPSHHAQCRGGREQRREQPEVPGTRPRMPPRSFDAQHRDQTRHDGSNTQQHVNCDDAQEQRIAGGDGEAANVRRVRHRARDVTFQIVERTYPGRLEVKTCR